MARIHGLVILLAIAGGTALWLTLSGTETAAPPLPDATPESAPPARRIEPTDVARVPVPADRAPGADQPRPAAIPAAPADPIAATASTANVHLSVRTLVQQQEVPLFRWSFQAAGAAPLRGQGEQGRAELQLPAAIDGDLLVEANGLRALERRIAVPAGTAAPLFVDLFLEPLPQATGVVLTARAPDGAPVTRLRLDLWQCAADAPPLDDESDPPGEPMWKRSGEAEDGAFALPPLPAGTYSLRAQAIDANSDALPLRPWRRRFAFAGHESLPFAIDFRPGTVLQIVADGDAGRGQRRCEVEVTAHGVRVAAAWRSRPAQGPAVTGQDAIVLPATATVLLALPPDAYAVTLRLGEQQVPLAQEGAAGDVRRFRAVLPQ